MSLRFDGRVALVTGAGKGLGRAYALWLAERGARVLVNNRRHPGDETRSSADATVAAIRARGGEALANYESVEDEDAGTRMVDAALSRWGRLDILITSAGIGEGLSFHKQSREALRRVFDVNFFGSLDVAHAAYRHMYERGYGRILFSSSGAGLYGNHGMAAYSSSKAALLGLMRTLHIEGQSHGVHCNAIAPYARTQMTEAQLSPQWKARLNPERVAPVAAWLVSEQCTLSGEIVVTGAGHLRRAQMVESPGCSLDDKHGGTAQDMVSCFDTAADMSGARGYPHAQAEFADLMSN